MADNDQYFMHGYLIRQFRPGPTLQRLNEVIRGLRRNQPRSPFRWEEKYPFSHDLRPDVFTYDDVFLDILFENGIPSFLKSVTGADLKLAHIQLRLAKQGDSYMDWHRDTHAYAGKIVGNVPPVHKLIFYPQEDREADLRLKILPGSHLRVFGNRMFDLLQARVSRTDDVLSSNERFLVFNTLLLHAAAAEKHPEGSFRLIFSFCHDFQLDLYKDQAKLHEAYRRRLGETKPAFHGAMADAVR